MSTPSVQKFLYGKTSFNIIKNIEGGHRQAVTQRFCRDTERELARLLAADSRRGPSSDDGFSSPHHGTGEPPLSPSPQNPTSPGGDDPGWGNAMAYAAALADQISPRGVLLYCL